ncbi:Ion-translocating oxidoreductase complex subunit E [Bienertia sinuspersici]
MLLQKLTVVEKELEAEKHEDHQQSKEKHLELLLGSKDIELNILPPEKSSNKGSGSGKRKKIEIVHLKEKIFSKVNDEDHIPVEDAVLLTTQTNVLGRTIMEEYSYELYKQLQMHLPIWKDYQSLFVLSSLVVEE